MAYNKPLGFICYNNQDIIRDGFILPSLTKKWIGKSFNENKLKKKKKGVFYNVVRKPDGSIDYVEERRKQLPASKIKIEILFSKVLRNAVSNPITGSDLLPFGNLGAGAIVGVGAGLTVMSAGGITSGTTEFTYQICDTETKINNKITVTKEVLTTGIIELTGYPVSVFGIVKEYIEIIGKNSSDDIEKKKEDYKKENPTASFRVNPKGEVEALLGLNFNDKQLSVIGNFYSGVYEGSPRLDIRGATDEDGLFHGRYGIRDENQVATGVIIEQLLKPGQENVFIKIVGDIRKFKFRGDNISSETSKSLPFYSKETIDITSKKIQIKTTGLKEGDVLYITYSVASERRVRQNLRQFGSIFQDNGIDNLNWQSELKSENDIFDYKIQKWYVPRLIPQKFDSPDSEFILDFNRYHSLKQKDAPKSLKDQTELIEGWRMSNVLSTKIEKIWAADYRGILLVTKKETTVILDRKNIKDQEWFNNYLKSLPFIQKHTDDNGEEVIDNVNVKIESKINFERLPECLFDISEVCNSQLYDKAKIPYYKPFAMALMKCSKFDSKKKDSGVGFPNLDIHNKNFRKSYSDSEMEIIDMSYSVFDSLAARPPIAAECDSDFDMYPYHYNCHIYDPADSGGIFFSKFDLQIPSFLKPHYGGFINSDWMLETPYFCSDFSRKSRIYIERIGGNALNNWSMVYADTVPASPSTISLDNNSYYNMSLLSFFDDNINDSTSIIRLNDSSWEQGVTQVEFDTTQTNERKPFDPKECAIIGYNRLIGSIPNYSNGTVVYNDISKICHDKQSGSFQNYNFLTGATTLNFNDSIPSLNIYNEWFVKDITLSYKMKDSAKLILQQDKNQYLSLYFKGTNSVINNISMPRGEKVINTLKIDCHYYHGGPLEFHGELLKHIDVKYCYGTILTKPLLDYAVQAGQTSIVFDKMGKTFLFFADDRSSNISVAMSYDNGKNWEIYTDIIRLIKGETASLPQAIYDNHGDSIRLFYVLNDTFLMCKKINPNWFVQNDLFVEYVPSDSYDENSKDDDNNNKESSIYVYTEQGKMLRREPSYFVEGNKDDEYYKKQLITTRNIQTKNGALADADQKQSVRFISLTPDKQMNRNFNGNAYAVSVDKRGIKRVYLLENNKLTIKSSPNFSMWMYNAIEVEIHKNVFEENRGETIEIKNIQVVKNSFEESTINLLYFHNGMLFLRNIQSEALNVYYKKDGQVDYTRVTEYFKITPNSGNKPIFLIGNIPEEIKDKIGKKDSTGNPLLAFIVPYNQEIVNIFNSNLELDTDTQPFGYYMRKGVIRLFYKDSTGNMNSISVGGFYIPSPEVLYKLKRELV